MPNVIKELQKRGFIDSIAGEELDRIVEKPIKVYVGFDPTADSLHLGNLVGIVLLKWFEKFGHQPVVLLGGGTGKIGDPSGKDKERPLLSEQAIEANVLSIKAQFEKCLENPEYYNNDTWLSSYGLVDFLRDVGKHFRLGPMLAKESVRRRLNSDEGMSFTEFTYQMLQGYDFYHLFKHEQVVLQVGGSDQWGNITAGIEVTRKLCGSSVYGMTFPLLTRSDGKKFGKSEGGAIWLDPQKVSPYKFYQYLYHTPDADVGQLMRLLTFMDLDEIIDFETKIKEGTQLVNAAQTRLAEEVTRFVHGKEGLSAAKKVTEIAAPGADAQLDIQSIEAIAADMENVQFSRAEAIGVKLSDLVAKSGFMSSRGEVSRLIKNGGAYLNNQKVEDPLYL
ncbi:MAG TPA: tyrosine--tRNA ligase, partial [Chlamydiales bacterium]|nr:tyrosine--tRNA ligase [Chlamydiales bacterium]